MYSQSSATLRIVLLANSLVCQCLDFDFVLHVDLN